MLLSAQAYDWNSVTIKANGFIDGIVYSPAAPNLAYIHTDMGGAYRWDQSANRWAPLTDWIQGADWSVNYNGAETMAVDPTDANRVYLGLGTYMGTSAVLRSTDQGRTWERTNVPFEMNGNGSARNAGERMNVDPNSPNILYYGARDDGLWKSTDYGATWNRVNAFPTIGQDGGVEADTGIVWTLFDKSSGAPGNATPVIYAGVVHYDAGVDRIYRSTDGGATWAAIPGGQPTTLNYFPQRAALTPDGNTLYLTYGYSTDYPGPWGISEGTVYKVTNPDAATPIWSEISPPVNYGFSGVAIDPTNPNTVYVTELGNYNPADRIWRSTNGGSSWTAITPNSFRDDSSAPYASSLGVHWLGDLQIDPFNNNVAMFTTGYGLYRTTNLTAAQPSWEFFNDGFEQSAVLELSSPNTGAVHLISAIGDRDGYRHDDFSQSPSIGRLGQKNGLARGTSPDIDAAFNDANQVIRVVGSSPYVQYSTNNGVDWAWMPSTGIIGGSGGNIAISADGTKGVYEPGGAGQVIYSTRSGSTWSSWSTPATNRPANGANIIADLTIAQTFYAYAGSTLSRSTDGGANWTVMTSSAPSGAGWIRALPGQAGHLVMSRGGNGLWRSTNGGSTWSQLANGVVTTANEVGVGMGPTSGSYPSIFVGGTVSGQNGFFRSDDQGATWTMISDLAHQYGDVTVIQGDPRVYGRLYVGANGRGILYADIHTPQSSLPDGWSTQDIGSPGSAGAAGSPASGDWEVIGGGAGIGGTSDQFRFAYTTLTGDGIITARVMDVPNASPANNNAKAGVMIRNALTTNSANVFMAMTPGSVNGAVFQARTTSGGSTSSVNAATGVWNPYWVRLTRVGNGFTAERSSDGVNWSLVGQQNVSMGSTVYVGLAVTASDNNQLNISSFQGVNVEATSLSVPTAPSDLVGTVVTNRRIDLNWSDNSDNEAAFYLERATDISFTQNLQTTVLGSNATSYSDENNLSPSTTYYYRVRAFNAAGFSTYSGVINRTTQAPAPPAAPGDLSGTVISSTRIDLSWTDNATNETAYYLERATNSAFNQNLVTFSLGVDAASYQDIGLSASTTYYYRVRASNIDGDSSFSDAVNYTTLPSTSIFTANQDIGSFTPAGTYSEDSGAYTVNGAGSDIWNTADQFQFVYKSLSGDGTIIARVDSVENTDVWAKAGVMFRNSLAAGSIHALMAITPGNGAAFQYRSSTNGNSTNNNVNGYAAPYWVKLTRSGNTFTGYRSADGAAWTQVGNSITLAMGSTVYVGLAVTSHSGGNLCTAVFSNVSVTTPQLPDADFDADGDIGGHDFLAWQRGYGIQSPNAAQADGDADNDLDVDGDDLAVWRGQFGTGGAAPAAALFSESLEAAPAVIAEPGALESLTVTKALLPLYSELVDAAIAWDLASPPRLKVHPAPTVLAEKNYSDWLPPAVSRVPLTHWHAGSSAAKHFVLDRAHEHADDIFDSEVDDSVGEQRGDRLCRASVQRRL